VVESKPKLRIGRKKMAKSGGKTTGKKAASAAGKLLSTSKSAAVKRVAASDLAQVKPKPKKK